MNTRTRAFELLPSSILATAAILGVIAALQPVIAVPRSAGMLVARLRRVHRPRDGLRRPRVLSASWTPFRRSSLAEPVEGRRAAARGRMGGPICRRRARRHGERDFFADHSHLTWVLIAFFGWGIATLLWATNQSGACVAVQVRPVTSCSCRSHIRRCARVVTWCSCSAQSCSARSSPRPSECFRPRTPRKS